MFINPFVAGVLSTIIDDFESRYRLEHCCERD